MNNPGDTPSAFDGPDLVEPEPFEPATDLGSLDTDRILRDTGSITLPRTRDNDARSREGSPHGVDEHGVDDYSPGETNDADTAVEDEESDAVAPVTRASRRASAQAEPKPGVPDAELETSGINILSVVSLILGLTLSPLTVVFGYIAVGQIRRAHQRGEAMAWFSIGLGWLWLVGYVVAGGAIAINWFQLSA